MAAPFVIQLDPVPIPLKVVAERMGLDVTTLQRWHRKGKFPAFRQGGKWYVQSHRTMSRGEEGVGVKGIQFSPESIAAIQARLKTQTRRKIKPQPTPGADAFWWSNLEAKEAMGEGWDYAPSGLWERDGRGLRVVAKPRYQPGELVYVKERWRPYQGVHKEIIQYTEGFKVIPRELQPDDDLNAAWTILHDGGDHWRSPLFMPEWASRLILKIEDVSAERCSEISVEDVLAEGVKGQGGSIPFFDPFCDDLECPCNISKNCPSLAKRSYKVIYDKLNGPGSFEKDWVWRYVFSIAQTNGGGE